MLQNHYKDCGRTAANTTKILAMISAEFGPIHDRVLDNIFKKYSEEYILEKIEYTKHKTNKGNTGFYPVAYFMSAIKHDYKSSKPENTAMVKKSIEFPEKAKIWAEDWDELKRSEAHWERLLQCAKKNNDAKIIEGIAAIVAECKDKLKRHFLERPKLVTDARNHSVNTRAVNTSNIFDMHLLQSCNK